MKRITLICAAGMSTNLLVKKMKEAAEKKNIEAKIIAMSVDSFGEYEESTDVLLLGPQVSFRLSEVKSIYEPKGIKVDVIDMASYGMLNGEKVLESALAMLD